MIAQDLYSAFHVMSCIYKPTKKSKHVYSLIVYDWSQETAHIQHTKTINNGTNFLVPKRETRVHAVMRLVVLNTSVHNTSFYNLFDYNK